MKQQTKKILRGVFFYVVWIVDSVRWLRRKRQKKQENDNLSD